VIRQDDRLECPLAISPSTTAVFLLGHHHLLVEQFTGITCQLQLFLQLGNSPASHRQLIGINAGNSLAGSRIHQRLMLPPEQRRRRNACLGRHNSDGLTSTETGTT
jgi:hypothetical protein